jgi:predicted transcriptional regulator
MTMTLLPSFATATDLAAINSMGVTTASVSAPETDIKKGKQLHLEHIKQDQAAADLANSAPSSAIKKQSIVKETPDVGILSKDFLKNKGQEELSVDKKFTIHRKKRAASVDVGILGNGRQQQQLPKQTKS